MALRTLLFAFFASCCAPLDAGAQPQGLSDFVWDAIKVFEGEPWSISSDFDCQGMSIGVAQWNLGKSFSSVKQIILSVPESQRAELMRAHGARFDQALNEGKQATLAHVRSLQLYADRDSCDAVKRKARWSGNGKVFVAELTKVLKTPHSVQAQRRLRNGIFENGRANAIRWARAIRGPASEPTLKEIAYFVDMQNFNGGGLQKFRLPYAGLNGGERRACSAEAINYLRTSDEPFLLHKPAARKNADLLHPEILDDSESALFCNAYKVALKLAAVQSRQFRLTTINRRAAILFGKAYYADRDKLPTSISLPAS